MFTFYLILYFCSFTLFFSLLFIFRKKLFEYLNLKKVLFSLSFLFSINFIFSIFYFFWNFYNFVNSIFFSTFFVSLIIYNSFLLSLISFFFFVDKNESRFIFSFLHFFVSLFIFLFFFICSFKFNFSLSDKFFLFFGDLFLCLFLFLYLVSLFESDLQKKTKNEYFNILNIQLKIANFKKLSFIFGILVFVSFWLLTESFANHIHYPLPKYLFHEFFAFYGIIIGVGILISINNFEKHLYEKYGQEVISPTFYLFVVSFGIIGAKFFDDFLLKGRNFDIIKFFSWKNFRDGGLSIFGGVLFSFIGFFLYYILFKPKILVRDFLDLTVPNILIGQSIGRWGNFFNLEIYGKKKFAFNSLWLPTLIKKQMTHCIENNVLNMVPLPLFLIESFVNIVGYFLIDFVGKKFKKYLSKGDLCCLYFVWYGLIRFFLEPLRVDDHYDKSSKFAILFLIVGLVGIIFLHIYDFVRWNKHTFFISQNKFSDKKNPYYKDE